MGFLDLISEWTEGTGKTPTFYGEKARVTILYNDIHHHVWFENISRSF